LRRGKPYAVASHVNSLQEHFTMPVKIADSGLSSWTPDRLGDLSGKRFLITGGNSGIGLEAAKMLGAAGADITIACRNTEKAEHEIGHIAEVSRGLTEFMHLDLADLQSVRQAAGEARNRYQKIDGLINNAGIMQTPQTTTRDGYELQFATNHLGHFLWTGLLFDRVEAAAGRVVVVASIAHRMGKIHFEDLMLENSYDPTVAYCQSKLANLLFALELDRRCRAVDSPAQCIACHPGYAATNLQSTGPRGWIRAVYSVTNALAAQSAYRGAIPTVLAAAGSEAQAGAYYGPQSFGEMRGKVSDASVAARALDEDAAARLWTESEKLVGYQWGEAAV
jgi:NAD(P)-dependent dehydrogenase (short-subunit alcohol dehydrogenase family)